MLKFKINRQFFNKISKSKIIDLRSDTITKPCKRMRQVIANAKVGDDVWGDDPTVIDLQTKMACLLDKESALFVPSGTMANLLSISGHSSRGEEIIVGDNSHIIHYEGIGATAYLGVGIRTIPNQEDGTLRINDILSAIRMESSHCPRTAMVALENTHNNCGGRVLDISYMEKVSKLCKEKKLPLHLDGARLANASIALNEPIEKLVKMVDSVSFCFSKGLGAPCGSIVAGTEKFINKIRNHRQSLGGSMRQVGLLAAGAMYAIENNFKRIQIDHDNAKRLANGLDTIAGINIDVKNVQTNILFFSFNNNISIHPNHFVRKLETYGILLGDLYVNGKIRAVTNLEINSDDIDYTIETIKKILSDI